MFTCKVEGNLIQCKCLEWLTSEAVKTESVEKQQSRSDWSAKCLEQSV